MISRQAIQFFEMLANFRKSYGAPPYLNEKLLDMQGRIKAFDEAILFNFDYSVELDRDDQESLFEYYQRLTQYRKKLSYFALKLSEYINTLSNLPKIFQLNIEETNIQTINFSLAADIKNLKEEIKQTDSKIEHLRNEVKGCCFVYVPDEINLKQLQPNKLYLKSNGSYQSLYKNEIISGSLLEGEHGNPLLDMGNLPDKICNDAEFKKTVLQITSARKHTAARETSDIKAEETTKVKPKPNTITLSIWYETTLEKRRTMFGHPSDGHISVDVCDENGNSRYVSFYALANPQPTILTSMLHIPSYQSVKGVFKQKIDDIHSYVTQVDRKFVEYEEIVFDCSKDHALDISNAMIWADSLLNSDEVLFNIYSNSCAMVGLQGLLAAGANRYAATPDANIITPQEVFDYAKSVKCKLDSLDKRLTDIKKEDSVQVILQKLISGPTNSDGVKSMQKLGDNITLAECQAIVRERDKGGFLGAYFQRFYSHSSFFGSGRKMWVDRLYHFLRTVDVSDENSSENLAKLAEIILIKESEMNPQKDNNIAVFNHYHFLK